MSYLTIIAILIPIWLLSFYLSRYDLFSPSCVMLLCLIVSSMLALYGINGWNQQNQTVTNLVIVIIVISGFSILLGGIIADHFMISKRLKEIARLESDKLTMVISISMLKYIMLLLAAIVLAYVYWRMMINAYGSDDIEIIASNNHASYFADEIIINKRMYSLSRHVLRLEKAIAIPFIVSTACSHKEESITSRIKKLLPVLPYMLCLILRGTRHGIILLLLTLILVRYVIETRSISSEKHIKAISYKYLLFLGVLAIMILAIFSTTALLLGQRIVTDNSDFVSYYFGSSIPAMNQAILLYGPSGIAQHDTLGLYTFKGFYEFLNSLGLTSVSIPKQLGWVYTGPYITNTFSAPYFYFCDFGILGVILLSVVTSFLYTKMYRMAKHSNGNLFLLSIVSVAYFCPSMFNFARTEDLFSSELPTLSTYVSILISYWLLRFCFTASDSPRS